MIYKTAHHAPIKFQKTLFAALMFIAAYMTTITVNAQTMYDSSPAVTTTTTGDVMSFGKNSEATLTGTIVDADENWIVVNSAGREIRVLLDDVELKAETDEVFAKGMQVTVSGKMEGESFGVPQMKARDITASKDGVVKVTP